MPAGVRFSKKHDGYGGTAVGFTHPHAVAECMLLRQIYANEGASTVRGIPRSSIKAEPLNHILAFAPRSAPRNLYN